jgi:hypothetical protein
MQTMPAFGDRVLVPFDQDKAEADVLEVSPLGGWVTVAIHIEGSDEPLRSVFDLADIEPASS